MTLHSNSTGEHGITFMWTLQSAPENGILYRSLSKDRCDSIPICTGPTPGTFHQANSTFGSPAISSPSVRLRRRSCISCARSGPEAERSERSRAGGWSELIGAGGVCGDHNTASASWWLFRHRSIHSPGPFGAYLFVVLDVVGMGERMRGVKGLADLRFLLF